MKAVICMIKITHIEMENINITVLVVVVRALISTSVINNNGIEIKTCLTNNGKLKVITHKSIIIMILKDMKRKSFIAKHNMRMIMEVEVQIITIIKTATNKSIRLNM